MKAPKKTKVRKQKAKPKSSKAVDKNKKEQVLIVAQEFKFARLLSGNEKKTRDRVLKTLKKWLQNCFEKGYEFKEDDFIRVWKGLFYAVWMSDKPLVQEDLCESIAEILDLFPPEQLGGALLMTKAGLRVLATEWYGIDQHRMDKFLMLVRRYQRGSLRCLRRSGWALPACRAYSEMLTASDGILCNKTPQYARNALSLILHFIDCFLEELAKVSQGEIPEQSLAALLRPFTALVCGGEALAACVAARRLLTGLLRQSGPGLRYQEATRAWQKMGCPEGGPEALELVSDDEGEDGAAEDLEDERPSALDPRAGRVNVLLPLLPVPATLLAAQLRGLMAQASSKAYKRARICLERFESLARDEYPLAVGEEERAGAEPPGLPEAPVEAARRLVALEKALVADSDELKLRGLKRKHRKRLLRKTRAGLSIMADVPPPPEPSATTANGDWQVEETKSDLEDKSNSEDTSNKENTVAKKSANRKRKVQENDIEKVKKAKSDDSVTDTSKVDIKVVKNKKIVNGNVKKEVNVNIKRNEVDKKKIKNLPKLIDVTPKRDSATALANKTDNKQSIKNKNKTKWVKEIAVSKIDNKQGITTKKQGKALENDKKLKRQKILPMNKIKNYQKQTSSDKNTSPRKKALDTPKKVKFVLKNNSMQGTMDYYKSVKQSPNIPFDSSKIPSKTNLKPSMPSPINPFFKKKLRMKF